VALSVDRVGNHTVKKLFRGLAEWEEKAVLTAELAQALHRLGGNAMGRSVVEACFVKEFLDGEDAWKAAVRKMQQREEFVEEIIAVGNKEKKDEKKKKRKRKKHGKREDAGNGDHDGAKKKSRVGTTTDVESIVNTISVGAKSN